MVTCFALILPSSHSFVMNMAIIIIIFLSSSVITTWKNQADMLDLTWRSFLTHVWCFLFLSFLWVAFSLPNKHTIVWYRLCFLPLDSFLTHSHNGWVQLLLREINAGFLDESNNKYHFVYQVKCLASQETRATKQEITHRIDCQSKYFSSPFQPQFPLHIFKKSWQNSRILWVTSCSWHPCQFSSII